MRNTTAGLIAALLLSVSAQAGPTCRLTFSEADLRFDTCIQGGDTFDVVGLRGLHPVSGPAGWPSLPYHLVKLLVPTK
jgi:hypothetical protein